MCRRAMTTRSSGLQAIGEFVQSEVYYTAQKGLGVARMDRMGKSLAMSTCATLQSTLR